MTNENRYLLGKVPHVKEILANLAMISAKTESHYLMSEVGTKSNGDDLAGIEAQGLACTAAFAYPPASRAQFFPPYHKHQTVLF